MLRRGPSTAPSEQERNEKQKDKSRRGLVGTARVASVLDRKEEEEDRGKSARTTV